MKNKELYRAITQDILSMLRQGVKPWEKPWVNGSQAIRLPMNGHAKRKYHGINILILWSEAADKGYTSNRWYTYKQAKKLGGHVRKGEKSTRIYYWNVKEYREEQEKVDEEGNIYTEEVTKKIPYFRYYNVFNLNQIEGIANPEPKQSSNFPDTVNDEAIESLNDIYQRVQVEMRHSDKNRAFYSPLQDFVNLPNAKQFKTVSGFFSTGFHELSHATGHESRLHRKMIATKSSKDYAFEELIAELSAAFLSAEFGIVYNGKESTEMENTASYIGSWIEHLENDEFAIIKAAKLAQDATTYILEKYQNEQAKAA